MDNLFGIPTSAIAIVCAALFAVALLTVGVIFFSNRIMFKMGMRNIPRRGAQTILVVVGLTLSTLIITAAFTTGDTINYSISQGAYNLLGRNDLNVTYGGYAGQADGGTFSSSGVQPYADYALATTLADQFADDPDVAGVLPYLVEEVSVLDQRTNLSEPAVVLSGFDPAALTALGGLTLTNGEEADLLGLGDNQAFVSKRAADRLDAQPGDALTVYVDGEQHTIEVAGVVRDELASGVLGLGDSLVLPGIAMSLDSVGEITGHAGQINSLSIALTGDEHSSVALSDSATARIQTWLDSPEGSAAVGPYVNNLGVQVDPIKADAVENAEKSGSIFVTFFLIMGMFSVAAGIMLIFMIFVMLAAERKPEMGMARAVGAQRKNLVQSFVSEGMAYSLLAGLLGAALGVGAAMVLVVGLMRLAGGDAFSFVEPHVTPASLVIGYTLGVVLTFITVVVSALRVSHLNIVAAIRGIDEEREREARGKISWTWLALSLPSMIIPPLGIYWLLRRGLGLPKAWVWGPLGIVSSLSLILLGTSSGLLAPFALGISILPLSVAALAGYYNAPRRLTWSIVGLLLAAYWLMPDNLHQRLFGDFSNDLEMFVIAGVMIVVAFTLLIVFNARLLTSLFERSDDSRSRYRGTAILGGLTTISVAAGIALGDAGNGIGSVAYVIAGVLGFGTVVAAIAARTPRIAPAMKMSIAYPLANRFRTGMTIAMFSLIIFSISVFSIVQSNFDAVFNGDDASGGTALVATANRGEPIGDLRANLAAAGAAVADDITTAGNVTVFSDSQSVREVGGDGEWSQYPVLAGDDAFFTELQPLLDSRATGYATDADVLDAVASQPGLALIDLHPVDSAVWSVYDFSATNVTIKANTFTPFQVEVRDPVSGSSSTVTVVGVLAGKLDSRVFGGVYTNAATYASVYGEPVFERAYLNLAAGVDEEDAAKEIRSALVVDGIQARSVQQMIDESNAEDKVFSRMFQGFMSLGLLVGIAALGVIAFRSVTERRQQVGMLRAIGYQSSDISLTFLLESAFIALMGILSGLVGAVILSRNLMNADWITEGSSFDFFVPWTELIAFVAIAFVFSMLMTWWPSRGASKIQIAEALRYE
jgi:putative ABC transport system permease protein